MYDMSKYGESITNEIVSEKISKDLETLLETEKHVDLNFSKINLLTTTCLRKIFGNIAKKIPAEIFFKTFSFKFVNDDMKTIISHGLEELY